MWPRRSHAIARSLPCVGHNWGNARAQSSLRAPTQPLSGASLLPCLGETSSPLHGKNSLPPWASIPRTNSTALRVGAASCPRRFQMFGASWVKYGNGSALNSKQPLILEPSNFRANRKEERVSTRISLINKPNTTVACVWPSTMKCRQPSEPSPASLFPKPHLSLRSSTVPCKLALPSPRPKTKIPNSPQQDFQP